MSSPSKSIVVGPKKKSHPCYVSGVFEVGQQLPFESSRSSEQRSVDSSITCDTFGDVPAREYPVFLTGYCTTSENLKKDAMVATRGRIIYHNDDTPPYIFHEILGAIPVGEVETFETNLANTTAVIGVGHVINTFPGTTEPGEKAILNVIVRHTDYDPKERVLVTFLMQYQIVATPVLEGTFKLCKPGREILFHGNIISYDPVLKRFIVNVISVSLMYGEESAQAVAPPPDSAVTKAGRIKPAKHVPIPRASQGSSKDMQEDRPLSQIVAANKSTTPVVPQKRKGDK